MKSFVCFALRCIHPDPWASGLKGRDRTSEAAYAAQAWTRGRCRLTRRHRHSKRSVQGSMPLLDGKCT